MQVQIHAHVPLSLIRGLNTSTPGQTNLYFKGLYWLPHDSFVFFGGGFVEDNATMSSIPYFENHVRYFVQNRRK